MIWGFITELSMKAREINRDERQKERKEIFSYYGFAHRPAIRYVMLRVKKDGKPMLVVLGKQQVCNCSRYDIRLGISYEFSLHNNTTRAGAAQ
jgi:hypothetical protein